MNGKFLVIFLLVLNLFAGVVAKVDKTNVIEGDNVAFSITGSGGNIIFPDITNIDGDDIEAVSSSQNISIINGNYQRTITKTYVFTPSHSLVIPSYRVIVDGKDEYTKAIKINVVKDKKTDQDFKLEIIAKKEAIVGYPNIITIKFYQKTNARISSIALEMPKGDFRLEQIGKEKDYYKGVYQIAEIKYKLIPKKAGDINFKVKLKLGFAKQSVDDFGFITTGMIYKTIQKSVKIKAKSVYNGLIGDFNISMSVDKTKVNVNEPINATLTIKGDGDLESLGNIKIDIPNVTIYDNKPIIKNNIYSKKFVIVADNNYTIPPLSLSFYSLKEKKVKTITTKEIPIEVIGHVNNYIPATTKTKQCDCKKEIVTKTKKVINYFYILIAFIIGGVLGFIISKIKFKKIELPKNLYNRLLPYADNPKIKEILNKLYNKEKLTKDDKEFLKGFFNENKRSS